MEEFNILDFVSVFYRRKKLFVSVFAVIIILACLVAFNWSNYRSVATIEIALPEVATSAVTSPDGAAAERENFADRRISYLQQKVLSTGSLVEIITKYNLYASERQKKPIAAVADNMRGKIKIDLMGGTFANPASAQKVSVNQLSAIAFNISFDYGDPLLTQQVANEIVTRFLDEDIKQRRSQAKETTAFLDSQLKTIEESLAEQEKKIAEFRATYGDSRPDALAFNQQAMTSMTMSLQNLESQITANLGTQGALRGQLAAIDPYSRVVGEGQVLTTPSTQLRALKSEYAALTAKYGPEHPDVIKVSRQIDAMKSAGGKKVADVGPLRALLDESRTKLAALQKTYGDDNPEIATLKKQIKSYETQISAARKAGPAAGGQIDQEADNPIYLQTAAQLRAAVEQGEALVAQKAALQEEIKKHQTAVVQNPVVEQQMAALTRDYENGQVRYRELKARRLESAMNEAIEEDRVGQRLQIINPPEVPLHTQPSRMLFLFGGFVFAFVASIAIVGAGQLFKPAVVGAMHLESITGVAPLVTVPHIMGKFERKALSPQHLKLLGGAAALFVIGLIVVSYFIMPLDVLLSVIALKLGL